MNVYEEHHLHSNMFLLIPVIKRSPVSMFEFTFQYVSINTRFARNDDSRRLSFTFQYVSINTEVDGKSREERFDLHSNMFLLIPGKATEG